MFVKLYRLWIRTTDKKLQICLMEFMLVETNDPLLKGRVEKPEGAITQEQNSNDMII